MNPLKGGQGGKIFKNVFSVIIPLYNKAPYVEKAIRSVAVQTFREFELIVIDDGSTDKSLAIAQKTLSTVFPPLGGQGANPLGGWGAVTQFNSGVSVARNNGVALAKYPYICFLDADDWWAPTFLEEMKALIDKYPDAGIYGSGYFTVKNGRERKAVVGVEPGFERGYINYCEVYARTLIMPLWTGAVVVPKSVLVEENGFKPVLKLGEDFDLWLRISLHHPVVLLNKPLAYYNQDVEAANRAIGLKFYNPEEHMLFSDYGELMKNKDFKTLYDKLAIYSLLPYYLNNVNSAEVGRILNQIDWKTARSDYEKYYRLPKWMVIIYFKIMTLLSAVKKKIYLHRN